MKIGVLVAGHTPETLAGYPALISNLLSDEGLDFAFYHVVDGAFPDGPDACDGWLITGSRHGAYEPLDWIPPLEDFIRAVVASGKPLVGICFGHQIIAQALGGKVEKYSGGWSIGLQPYTYFGTRIAQNAWHQDQVTRPPEGAEVVATGDVCAYAALLYDTRAFSVQWHPEFDSAFVDGLIETRARGVVPDPLIARAQETLPEANDNTRIARDIGTFLRERRIA